MGTGGPGGANPLAGYNDPFRGARITPSRVDMGVDYIGRGNIFAPGPGIITEADNAWLGAQGAPYPGTFIVEKITAGALKGKSIYVAEDVVPTVHVGQHVTSDTVIGRFTGAGFLETGYAWGTGGETLAAHYGQQAPGDPGAWPSAAGEAYNNFLQAVGTPPGTLSGKPHGTLPKGFPFAKGMASGTGKTTGHVQTTSIISSILGGILGGTSWKDTLERFGLIVLGGALILIGIWMLAGKAATKVAVSVAAPEATAASKAGGKVAAKSQGTQSESSDGG